MMSLGLLLAVGLAAIHAFASTVTLPRWLPIFRWISFAGGVSIGYVFLEILPELSHAQHEVGELELPLVAYLENHVYILALLGLTVFYGLDILALHSRKQNQVNQAVDQTEDRIFWIHLSGFAILNIILGYLMQDLKSHGSLLSCILFFVAIALHFFILDYHLREHHKKPYDQIGRWLLTGSIILGAILGQALHLNEAAVAIIWSFLAGSIILNVLKHELPSERESCFSSFLGGTGLYAVLILGVQST
ncbi:MAG: hypothetical protein F6J87_17995 [Spirulina sp. SIO3F2]|nr:hypothetical protein [Spirulina sp. SIO3F2]